MSSRQSSRAVVAVAAIACIAAAVRLAGLAREPLFVDEAYSARFSVGSVDRMLDLIAKDIHPPLYYLGLSVWRGCLGDSVFALRSFSVFWSLIGLGALALLAQQLVGDRGAVLAVMVAALVHPLDVHFAQTARMYSQLAALSTLAAWLLWRWMICAGERERARVSPWAVSYGATAVLLLYTHYLGSVILVSQGMWALVYFAHRRRWSSFAAYLSCALVAAVAFVPWMDRVLRFRDGLYSVNHLRWIPAPGIDDGVGILFHELIWGLAQFQTPWSILIPTMAVGCVVGATFVLVRSRVRPGAGPHSNTLAPHGMRVGYAAWLLFAPVGFALVVSWVYHPIFYPPRFALVVLPPFLVLLGLSLAEIHLVCWRRIVFGIFVAILMISTAVDSMVISQPRMDALVQLWQREGEPELVVFFPTYAAKICSYYLGERVRSAPRDVVELLIASGTSARIWICTTRSWRPGISTDSDYRKWLLERGPNRVLMTSKDLEVVQIELGSTPNRQPESTFNR